jgi:hypothetical protein
MKAMENDGSLANFERARRSSLLYFLASLCGFVMNIDI